MTSATSDPRPQPVTVVLTRRVKPGSEQAFEAVLHRIADQAVRFPGHEGVTILRPEPDGRTAYVLVLHFRSKLELQAWTTSSVRATLLAEADAYSDDMLETQQSAGLEGWFRLPGAELVRPPPRFKMAITSWIGIVPLLVPVSLWVAPHLTSLPLALRPVPAALVITFAMTYLIMPILTRALRAWLWPARQGHAP
ncbi:MAG: antibiotic biosynthesis monooxygenase [Pseudonocardiales bacterium]|nr:MAG: antibiotic biosynthesis monooxygenase [Pseudonocardiales bacterium]